MMQRFRGFHGTRADLVDSIVEHGLRPSRDHDEWLGYGSYYFIDGLEDAWSSARDWARVEAWDKRSRCYRETDFAVIEYEITVETDRVFDLRIAEHAKEFHRLRDAWEQRHYHRRRPGLWRPEEDRYDTVILNRLKNDHKHVAVIGHFFIQLTVKERHWQRSSRIPNVAVLCLSDPIIAPTTVEVVKVDYVPFETIMHLEGLL